MALTHSQAHQRLVEIQEAIERATLYDPTKSKRRNDRETLARLLMACNAIVPKIWELQEYVEAVYGREEKRAIPND